jgi:hypothetical protein
LFDSGDVIRLAADHASPKFDAWLARESVATAVFLPAYIPQRKVRARWSARQLKRLQRQGGDVAASAGEQAPYSGPAVLGLFLPV